ncbi:MAG: orotidine-5'-phosphate decarboxylase [Planctomycetes bacterium]|nr:orotidine-5'-phosphate decarboxylase [Planctomycetota bacterium]
MSALRPPFAERLGEAMERKRSRLVVGIDPVLERLPAALRALPPERALAAFAEEICDAVAEHAVAVKPQAAFFERYGARGWSAFEHAVRAAAQRGLLVIADAKRGDIGSTAAAYADAFLGDDPETCAPFIDALTVNPYLGLDALEPFAERARTGGRGLFVLARTSNPGSRDFQERSSAGEPLYLAVARAVAVWSRPWVGPSGYGPVGLVAGATFPAELPLLREAAPQAILLLPGIGAQGGRIDGVRAAFDEAGKGAVVASSREIIYAYERAAGGAAESSWQAAVRSAARATKDAIEAAL